MEDVNLQEVNNKRNNSLATWTSSSTAQVVVSFMFSLLQMAIARTLISKLISTIILLRALQQTRST